MNHFIKKTIIFSIKSGESVRNIKMAKSSSCSIAASPVARKEKCSHHTSLFGHKTGTDRILHIEYAGENKTRHGCIKQFTTAEYQVKQHMFGLQYWHHSCFTSQQSGIQPWHSTQSMQTQGPPPFPAGSTMMDELSNKGFSYILNSPWHNRATAHCSY